MSLTPYFKLSCRPSIILLTTLLIITIFPMVLAVFNIDGNTGKLEMMIKQQDHRIVLLETSNQDQASEIANLKAQNRDLKERLTILENRFNRIPATNEDIPNELSESEEKKFINQKKTEETLIKSPEKSTPNSRSGKQATSGVHFFVQRKKIWNAVGIIPFEIETLNVGGAMDLSTGIFTTPKSGIYHFTFTGIKDNGGDTYVDLRLNENQSIVYAYGDKISPWGTLSLTATIELRTDDTICIFKNGTGGLYDSLNPYTSFTGSLLMEENSSAYF